MIALSSPELRMIKLALVDAIASHRNMIETCPSPVLYAPEIALYRDRIEKLQALILKIEAERLSK